VQLRLAITDLYGNVVARLDRFRGAEVTIPWNESRTARVILNVQDGAASQVLVLERMLKIWLAQNDGSSDLIFWGPILSPTWTLHENTVEINAHDLSVRLKHHYLTARDAAVTTPGTAPDDYKGSVPVSFVGLRRLRDAGKNTSGENGDGVPDLGIINGSNTHPGATREFAQTTTVGSQPYPAGTLHVADGTQFAESGTIYLGATLGGPPTYTISGATQTLAYTGKTTGSGFLTGITGWSGSGTIAGGTSVILDGGKAKRMLTERGENVWDKFQELAQLPTGPDFELEPYDGPAPVGANGLNESTDVPKTIATAGSVGLRATSDIVVTDPGHVQTMHVSLWITRNHTQDMTLILTAPDGRDLTLVERTAQAADGANYGTGSAGASRTDFDDNATTAIEDGTPPYVGFFVPHQNLKGLRDMVATGTWTLKVYAGSLATSAGTLHNWAINFILDTEPPVTPPYAKLNTFNKEDASPGGPKDKRSTAVFVFGFARENVEELTYSPTGDSVRNRVTAVTANTGGDGNVSAGLGPTKVQRRSNLGSRQRYGNYEQWEAAGSLAKAASPEDTLGAIAEYWLESLAYPPQQVEITPATVAASGGLPGILNYMRDFRVGDLVRLAARWGNVSLLDPATGATTTFVDVIIREVGISQKDDAGNISTKLTCVPFVPAPPVVDDPSA
jgi:subtilisin-like proprotein convertase family protein